MCFFQAERVSAEKKAAQSLNWPIQVTNVSKEISEVPLVFILRDTFPNSTGSIH